MTPSLATGDVLCSLLAYIAVYVVIYSFGLAYIYGLLRDGPAALDEESFLKRASVVGVRAARVGGK